MINARWVEDEFRRHLLDRIEYTDYEQMLYDALANVRAHNAQALVSVPEQIKRYEQSIASFQEGLATYLNLRRFIRLVTDCVSIDEYSSHFIRLTVVWCAPSAQVDVCYFYREKGGKLGWSEEDEKDLARLYPTADRLELMQRFPTKTWLCIREHANEMGLGHHTRQNSTGILDRVLSLADWELMQKYGWKREKGAHCLFDVPAAECSPLPTIL